MLMTLMQMAGFGPEPDPKLMLVQVFLGLLLIPILDPCGFKPPTLPLLSVERLQS